MVPHPGDVTPVSIKRYLPIIYDLFSGEICSCSSHVFIVAYGHGSWSVLEKGKVPLLPIHRVLLTTASLELLYLLFTHPGFPEFLDINTIYIYVYTYMKMSFKSLDWNRIARQAKMPWSQSFMYHVLQVAEEEEEVFEEGRGSTTSWTESRDIYSYVIPLQYVPIVEKG